MDKEAQKTLLDTVIEALPDHPEGNIWSDGTEILCKTAEAAGAIGDLLELLCRAEDGEDQEVNTGYYDPAEDKINGEEDRYTGWWYVTFN